jgi:hypothetical protein
MVVMALVTTFMTTPAVIHLYPEWYQKKTSAASDDSDDMTGSDNRIDAMALKDNEKGSIKPSSIMAAIGNQERYCLVTMLNRIETVPSLMAMIQLLKRDRITTLIEIHALRLLELTERTSAVMKFKDLRETKRQDPVLNVLRTFTNLIGIQSLQTHLDFCSAPDYIKTVSQYSKDVNADLILLPWINRYLINNENYASALVEKNNVADLEFVHSAFSIQHCNVGLFVDRGFGQIQDGDIDLTPQIIVAYRGGPDDRAALLFALRLQAYRKIDLTVLTQGQEDDVLKYASNESIRLFTQDTNVGLESLFSSDVPTYVVCQRVSVLNGSITIKSLVRPLNKHDLIIVGRGSAQSDGEDPSIPTTPAITSMENKDYEMALGQLGYSVLKIGTKNPSVLIIQSANKPSASGA